MKLNIVTRKTVFLGDSDLFEEFADYMHQDGQHHHQIGYRDQWMSERELEHLDQVDKLFKENGCVDGETILILADW